MVFRVTAKGDFSGRRPRWSSVKSLKATRASKLGEKSWASLFRQARSQLSLCRGEQNTGGTCLNLFDRNGGKETAARDLATSHRLVQNSSHQLATFARPTDRSKSMKIIPRKSCTETCFDLNFRNNSVQWKMSERSKKSNDGRAVGRRCDRNMSLIASSRRERWLSLFVPWTVISHYASQVVGSSCRRWR